MPLRLRAEAPCEPSATSEARTPAAPETPHSMDTVQRLDIPLPSYFPKFKRNKESAHWPEF